MPVIGGRSEGAARDLKILHKDQLCMIICKLNAYSCVCHSGLLLMHLRQHFDKIKGGKRQTATTSCAKYAFTFPTGCHCLIKFQPVIFLRIYSFKMLFKLKHRKPRKHVILKYLKHNRSVFSLSYKTRYRPSMVPPCNYT